MVSVGLGLVLTIEITRHELRTDEGTNSFGALRFRVRYSSEAEGPYTSGTEHREVCIGQLEQRDESKCLHALLEWKSKWFSKQRWRCSGFTCNDKD